jgi:hypothetical protein
VDDNPSSYSHPSVSSSGLWYIVRFNYRGLHPAVSLMEEDLEAVTDEISREETPATVKLSRRSRREIGDQIVKVSTKRKYFFITLIAILALTGTLVALNVTGGKDNYTAPEEFPSTTNPPIITEGPSDVTLKLAFATELVGATAGSAFPIQPAVKVVDNNGNIVDTSTAAVTLIVTNYSANLYGTTTVNAVNGVATFTDLYICLAGFDYSLTAISPAVTSSLSNLFNVGPNMGVKLDFITEPAASGLSSRFSVKVVVKDVYGNIDTNSTAEVTLSIAPGSGAPGAILSGTTTQRVKDGVATFNYLSIVPEYSNYKLTATSPGLTSATSHSFNVSKLTEN